MVCRYHESCSIASCVKEKRIRRFDINLPPIVDPHHIRYSEMVDRSNLTPGDRGNGKLRSF